MKRAGDEVARFWSHVAKSDGCWMWTKGTKDGYGQFRLSPSKGKRLVQAHRYAYEAVVGPIPTGLHLDHLCRVRRCVNPDHLEPVTQAENNRRAFRGKTHCFNGHLRTPETTIVRKAGTIACRTCRRESDKRRRQEAVA